MLWLSASLQVHSPGTLQQLGRRKHRRQASQGPRARGYRLISDPDPTVAKLQPQPRAAPLLLACDARPLTQRPIPMLLASWPSPPLIQRHMLQNKLRSAQGFGTPARGTSARSATRVSKIHSHVIVQNRRTDRFVLQTDLDSVQGLTRAPCTFPNPSSSAQASIMQGMHSSRRSKPTLGR